MHRFSRAASLGRFRPWSRWHWRSSGDRRGARISTSESAVAPCTTVTSQSSSAAKRSVTSKQACAIPSDHDDFVNAALLNRKSRPVLAKPLQSNTRWPGHRQGGARLLPNFATPRTTRTALISMPLLNRCNVISRSRSRRDDIADALHRKCRFQPFAQFRELGSDEEHTGCVQQHPLCDPIFLLPSEMQSL
jgi:hypothetical protein